MNNKHIACVIIGLMVFMQIYAVLIVNGKAEAMKQEATTARDAAAAAKQQVDIANIQLTTQKVKSEAVRNYLSLWDPYLRQAADEERGPSMIDEMIKNSGINAITKNYPLLPNANNAYVPKLVRGDLLFEDDYHKTMEWIGELERSFPASRVSKCRITKGGNANDVKLELLVELPIVDAAAAPPAAGAPAAPAPAKS